MDHLRCVVERITYQNETNGFSVIKSVQSLIDILSARDGY